MLIATIILFALIFFAYKKSTDDNNNKMSKDESTKDDSQNILEGRTTRNWIEHFIKRNGFSYQERESKENHNYRMPLVLISCQLDIFITYEKATKDVYFNFDFPFVVDEGQFDRISGFVDEFNAHDQPLRLTLDKNTGIMHLYSAIPGHISADWDQNQHEMFLNKLLSVADSVYPQAMRILYGGALPALAVMQLLGQRLVTLN